MLPWLTTIATFSNCSKKNLISLRRADTVARFARPWKPTSAFQDSLTCINYGYPYRAHPCNECHLLDFVSPEHHGAEVPCHYIPLNEAGETIEDLEAEDNEAKLERKLETGFAPGLNEIEEERAYSSIRRMPLNGG